MKIRSILITILFTLALSACERSPNINSPKHYEKHGISFDYPGNWKISEDGENDDVRYLVISSTGDSLFLIHSYISEEVNPPELADFAQFFSDVAAREMPFGEMKTESIKPITKPDTPTWLKETLAVIVLSQSVPYTREYRQVKQPTKSAFLTSQASDENKDKVGSGFKLIYQSFKFTE